MISLRAAWVLVLALGIPFFAIWRYRRLRDDAISFPPMQLGQVAARVRGGWRALLALETAILLIAIITLAGPRRLEEIERFEEEGIDVALVLDISASMQAGDFPPNRLDVLKKLSTDFVKRGGGNRIGIYAFAGFAFTQTPFTTDTDALVDLIDSLAYESITHDDKSGGTAIGDALLLATSDLERLRIPGRDQVAILVTDGESNMGADPLLGARYLRDHGVRLYVIGIGQDKAVPVSVNGTPFIALNGKQLTTRLDDAQLKQIAELAGGTYQRADSADLLGRIFDQLARLGHKPFQARGVEIELSYAPEVALLLFALVAAWLALDGLRLRRPLR